MTAINHSITGAFIGLAVGRLELALPIALASHYVCDALPHFGTGLPDKIVLKTRAFRNYLIIEALLCMAFVALLTYWHPQNWFLAAVCAFVAASPDLISADRYFKFRAGKRWRPNIYTRFAGRIQWFERPIGAAVEIAWLTAGILLLAPFLK